MQRLLIFSVFALLGSVCGSFAAEPVPDLTSIGSSIDVFGQQLVSLVSWPAKNQLLVVPPFVNVARAYFAEDSRRTPLQFELKPDASAITYYLPAERKLESPSKIVLETVEATEQFNNGRITLSALDAEVFGPAGETPKAKLETQPGTHRIGFWTNEKDFVRWQYSATRPGMYHVELTYAAAKGDGTEIEITVGEKSLTAKLISTGSFYRYTVLDFGKIYIPATGKLPVTVRCLKKTGDAVMNLKAVTLRPACEGTPPKADEAGVLTCHARDVTIDGIKVQYEPKPEKNTVGYWINKSDTVHWDFDVAKAGKYEVEILQGCGKDQGGSEVLLKLGSNELRFTVEDTGHFQNFKPRVIGEMELQPGPQTLRVIPLSKANAAVMDLRQVKLTPKK